MSWLLPFRSTARTAAATAHEPTPATRPATDTEVEGFYDASQAPPSLDSEYDSCSDATLSSCYAQLLKGKDSELRAARELTMRREQELQDANLRIKELESGLMKLADILNRRHGQELEVIQADIHKLKRLLEARRLQEQRQSPPAADLKPEQAVARPGSPLCQCFVPQQQPILIIDHLEIAIRAGEIPKRFESWADEGCLECWLFWAVRFKKLYESRATKNVAGIFTRRDARLWDIRLERIKQLSCVIPSADNDNPGDMDMLQRWREHGADRYPLPRPDDSLILW